MAGQLVYRPGGVQSCHQRLQVSATKYNMQTIAWPDAAEHDPAKEAVEVHAINVEVCEQSLQSWYVISSFTTLYAAWRSGIGKAPPASTLTSMDGFLNYAWIRKIMRQIRTHSTLANVPWDEVKWPTFDHRPEPVIASPYGISIGVMVNQDPVDCVFTALGSVSYEVHYKWIKAGSSELNAYLRWEALD